MVKLPIAKRLILLGYYIFGSILGIFLKPTEDIFTNFSIGFLIALISSFLVFPELRRAIPTIVDGKNSYGINIGRYFTHPTQKPMMLGALWFLITAILLSLINSNFPLLIPEESRLNVSSILIFLPVTFLFGYGGFQMIKRNETIGKFGEIHKGFWAYLNGTLSILFGWGGFLFIFLALIFKWD